MRCQRSWVACGQDCSSRKVLLHFPFSDSCLYHPGVPIFHDALKVSGAAAGTAAAGKDLVPGGIAHT